MPQLDLIIVFPQIFWLLLIFFLTYTIFTHFFLPLFVKSLKARKRIVLKNVELLTYTQKNLDLKKTQLNTLLNQNFDLIKSLLETELFNLFNKELIFDLSALDTKVVKVLYHNILYYDTNLLDSISLSPKFLTLTFKN